MILEASALNRAEVISTKNEQLARVDRLVFDADKVKLARIQIVNNKILKKFLSLDYQDVLSADRGQIVVDSAESFSKDLTSLDQLYAKGGKVIGVKAVTQSGQTVGRVSDVAIDETTGLITRFYLQQLLTARIIPRPFLVKITPQKIIFENAINSPTFNQLASQPQPNSVR